MTTSTKNVGQVAGLYLGTTPPVNVKLIWYDSTPNQQIHKVYDPGLKRWVVLNEGTISLITYSELVNIAKGVGLTLGQWFQIKDKANTLALAITTTKVQYTDSLGNILIDDLGTNIQYHVTSSNLLIDDVAGVFDLENRKLVFEFKEKVPDFTADDYILGKTQRLGVWGLAKFKLSSFLSKVTGNSLKWEGGFYFNFSDAIKTIKDKEGGIVSKTTYDADKQTITQSIENVGKENQEIISNAKKYTDNATNDTAVYSKKIPVVNTSGEPLDVAKGDTLSLIVSKIQRWINKFKVATGINLSPNFSSIKFSGKVNNNDSVETAIAKLQNQQANLKLKLPAGFQPSKTPYESLKAEDEFSVAFSKIEADRRLKKDLETPWTATTVKVDHTGTIETIHYRIVDGVLEIDIPDGLLIAWLYTENVVDDKVRFKEIDFSKEFVNKIRGFLSKGEKVFQDYDIYVLSNLCIGSISNLQNIYIDTSVSFACMNDPVEGIKIGLCYVPNRVSFVERSGEGTPELPYDFKLKTKSGNGKGFRGLISAHAGVVMAMYLPPVYIRYKLC